MDFTERPEEIENALRGAQLRGRTSMLDLYGHSQNERRPLQQTCPANHFRGWRQSPPLHRARCEKCGQRKADVLIYAVGTYDRYAPTQEELLGPMFLDSVADVTGGQSYTLTNLAELPQVTRAIGTHLRHLYMLTYRPQTPSRDGKWHKINVKVLVPNKLSTFLRVRARTGYYANSE